MGWIHFDEADHRRPVPDFRLPSVMGRPVALGDYRGRDNLVVFFPRPGRLDDYRAALQEFADHQREYLALDTVVLAILPEDAGTLAKDAALADLPFPVLADPQRKTRRLYAGLMAANLTRDDDPLLFVLDQYGCPYAAFIGASTELQAETQQWLEYISVQCPE